MTAAIIKTCTLKLFSAIQPISCNPAPSCEAPNPNVVMMPKK